MSHNTKLKFSSCLPKVVLPRLGSSGDGHFLWSAEIRKEHHQDYSQPDPLLQEESVACAYGLPMLQRTQRSRRRCRRLREQAAAAAGDGGQRQGRGRRQLRRPRREERGRSPGRQDQQRQRRRAEGPLRRARGRRLAGVARKRGASGGPRVAAPASRLVRETGQDWAGDVQHRVQGAGPGDGEDGGAEEGEVREHGSGERAVHGEGDPHPPEAGPPQRDQAPGDRHLPRVPDALPRLRLHGPRPRRPRRHPRPQARRATDQVLCPAAAPRAGALPQQRGAPPRHQGRQPPDRRRGDAQDRRLRPRHLPRPRQPAAADEPRRDAVVQAAGAAARRHRVRRRRRHVEHRVHRRRAVRRQADHAGENRGGADSQDLQALWVANGGLLPGIQGARDSHVQASAAVSASQKLAEQPPQLSRATTEPFACDPSDLPKLPPSKEYDVRMKQEEARRQRKAALGGRGAESVRPGNEKRVTSRAANVAAELKQQTQTSSKSNSDKFNPEDSVPGFRVEPRALPTSAKVPGFGSSWNTNHPTVPGRACSSVRVANASSTMRTKGSSQSLIPHLGVTDLRGAVDATDQDHPLDMPASSHKKIPENHGRKFRRIHHSGPLMPPGGNIEDMLKEHERHIQEAVRKARLGKPSR